MNCNICNNIKASITFNNINYCLSCFHSKDIETLILPKDRQTDTTPGKPKEGQKLRQRS